MEVNNKLKKTRKKLGLTQMELAEKIGINPSYYNCIENGKMIPTKDIQSSLSEYFISRGYAFLEEDLFPRESQDFYDSGKRNSLEIISQYQNVPDIEEKIESDHIRQVVLDRLLQTKRERDIDILFDFYGLNSKEKTIEELSDEKKLSYERVRQIIGYGTRVLRQNKVKNSILEGNDFYYDLRQKNLESGTQKKKELEIPLWWIAEKILGEC
jgi:transcriptional regulator with XRE-family HTH domain